MGSLQRLDAKEASCLPLLTTARSTTVFLHCHPTRDGVEEPEEEMPGEITVIHTLAWYFSEPGFAMSLVFFRHRATLGQTLQAVWALVSLTTFV